MKDSFAQKIYTRKGIARENPFPGKKVLHIGCGASKLPGAIGIDQLKLPGVDVVHNLDRSPWPFESNSFDIVFAHSVLEHLDSVVEVMNEIHRVGKPGARVILCVPYFRSVDSFDDPTHRHFFTARSMDYFIDDTRRADYAYTDHRFTKVAFWYGWPQPSKNLLATIIKTTAQRFPRFYDQYLSYLFPFKILVWELEIKK